MKYEITFWKEVDASPGRHIATLIVDTGTIYDDWETASSDPGLFVIGTEGKGIASLESYGAMFLHEHILSTEPLLVCSWRMKTRTLFVGLRGSGTICKAKPSHWNDTAFQCRVTKRW